MGLPIPALMYGAVGVLIVLVSACLLLPRIEPGPAHNERYGPERYRQRPEQQMHAFQDPWIVRLVALPLEDEASLSVTGTAAVFNLELL